MAAAAVEPASLSIGQVASEVGLRASALRYYEAVGLLPAAVRVGGKRRYDRDTVDRLLLIRFSQRLGFTLTEIRRLLKDPSGQRQKTLWRELIDGKLQEIDELVRSAKGVQRVLRESRDCDCVTLTSCCYLRDESKQPASAWTCTLTSARKRG